MRELSSANFSTYEQLVEKAQADGFERVEINIPTRRDVVEFKGIAIFKGHGMLLQLNNGIGSEGGRRWSILSVSLSDKSAVLSEVVREVSEWLGAEPEYPALSAQFFVLENAASRTPISLSESGTWHKNPMGTLAQYGVFDGPAGTSVSRIASKAI